MGTPAGRPCVERDRLIEAYTEAAHQYDRLRSDRLFALIRGAESPTAAELTDAEAEREKAKIAILAHLKEHGC